MHSKIIIVGKAASGKDYFRRKMINKGFVCGISCTTRPIRIKSNETEGVEYYFKTVEEFDELIKNDMFIEYQVFNGWKYGITYEEFDKCDVMIMNAESVKLLKPEYINMCFVIYLDIELKHREARLISRDDNIHGIYSRLSDDDRQFLNFSRYDCKITNFDF